MCNFGVFLKSFTIIILIACMLLPQAYAAQPALSAHSAILINADSGECILNYGADEKRGMASTTKIMTAVVAIESFDLDKKIRVPDAAIGVEGSSLYLKRGESITMRDLLYGLLLRSANDAAAAIAITIGGDIDGFAGMMNRKAEELGLSNTHFTNPHGLFDENHYTTARDLAEIAKYALQNETFREICSSRRATISGTEGDRVLVNHNKMLFIYNGAYGVKTGFTKATGRCLVSAAERDGISLIAVTLNAPNDWDDHTEMLDYGFSEYESVCLAKSGELSFSLPLIGGETDAVTVKNFEDVTVCVKKSRGSIIEKVQLNKLRFAPVYSGDTVGTVQYVLDGKVIAEVPLKTTEYVGKRVTLTLFDRILNLLS